jgi:hypothetical protein
MPVESLTTGFRTMSVSSMIQFVTIAKTFRLDGGFIQHQTVMPLSYTTSDSVPFAKETL